MKFVANKSELFLRVCCNCGCGMNEGYVWGDGEGYACSDECLFVDGYTQHNFDADYEDDNIYYTEWEEDGEDTMYLKDGTIVTIW